MDKKWQISAKYENGDLLRIILQNRGIETKSQVDSFLHPQNPEKLTPQDVGINEKSLHQVIKRIKTAIKTKESIVVYADYDADGITAGAIVWESLFTLGAKIMPYVPHRVEEGYGLSVKGLDAVKQEFNPTLVITVDHGITAAQNVAYAKKLGMEVIVTDHHVKPAKLPKCLIVHTTKLSGAGVAWFVVKELLSSETSELLALATIGTIADMIPLLAENRALVSHGLAAFNKTKRLGLLALMADAGLLPGELGTYEISHILAPRLNAMGRLEHALDALRLLCTKNRDKAAELAQKLGLKNRERQQLTEETTQHALKNYSSQKKLIFISHKSYNPGVIGLVAGKLVEEYYRPAIVVSEGEKFSKASARSIKGFNIVEAIRTCSDILVDVGGHPLAAGFTVETIKLGELKSRLEQLAEKELDEEKLTRTLKIDVEIPLEIVTFELWQKLQELAPFGFGNPEPVFVSRKVRIADTRLVGKNGKHLKMILDNNLTAIAFSFGSLYGKLKADTLIDIAYSINLDTWNGGRRLQLKIKDLRL